MKQLFLMLVAVFSLAACNHQRDPLNRFEPMPQEITEFCLKKNPQVSRAYCELDRCLASPFVLRAVVDLLKETRDVLNELGLADQWFIEGGMLIGAERYKKPFPWDDDADVGMLASVFEPNYQRIKSAFLKRGLELYPFYEQAPVMSWLDRDGLYQLSLTK